MWLGLLHPPRPRSRGRRSPGRQSQVGEEEGEATENQGVAGHPRCCSSLFGPDGEDGRCCAAFGGRGFCSRCFRGGERGRKLGRLARSESISSRHSTEVPAASIDSTYASQGQSAASMDATCASQGRANVGCGNGVNGPFSASAEPTTLLCLRYGGTGESHQTRLRQGLVTRAEQAEWDLCGACPCSSILPQPLGPRRCLGEKCLHIRALAVALRCEQWWREAIVLLRSGATGD